MGLRRPLAAFHDSRCPERGLPAIALPGARLQCRARASLVGLRSATKAACADELVDQAPCGRCVCPQHRCRTAASPFWKRGCGAARRLRVQQCPGVGVADAMTTALMAVLGAVAGAAAALLCMSAVRRYRAWRRDLDEEWDPY